MLGAGTVRAGQASSSLSCGLSICSLGFLPARRPPDGQTSHVALRLRERGSRPCCSLQAGWNQHRHLHYTGQSSKTQPLLPHHSRAPAIRMTDHVAVTLSIWLRGCWQVPPWAAPLFLFLPFHTEPSLLW